jgi:hypothetical protein
LSVNLKIALLLASFTVFTIGIVKAMLYAVKTHQEWWLDFVPVNNFPTVSADEIATIVRNAVNKSFQDSLRGNLLPAPELPDAELEMLPQANCTYPDVCPHKPEGCNGECTYYRPNPD